MGKYFETGSIDPTSEIYSATEGLGNGGHIAASFVTKAAAIETFDDYSGTDQIPHTD